MTKLSPRQRAREAYGELDEIVVRLFDDLAAEHELPRSAGSAATGAVSSQRNSRRPNQRPAPASTADSAQERDLGARLARGDAAENRSNGTRLRGGAAQEFDIERLFADESRQEEDAESLAPEEEKFVEHVVAWLAPRPNADLLLDRIEETLWLKAGAAPRQDAAEKERGDESAAPPATGEEKPTEGGT